jgi:hypothetical protein
MTILTNPTVTTSNRDTVPVFSGTTPGGVQVNVIIDVDPAPIATNQLWGGRKGQGEGGSPQFRGGFGYPGAPYVPRTLQPHRQWQGMYQRDAGQGPAPYQPRPHAQPNPYPANPDNPDNDPFAPPESDGDRRRCNSHGRGRGERNGRHGRGEGRERGEGIRGEGGRRGEGGPRCHRLPPPGWSSVQGAPGAPGSNGAPGVPKGLYGYPLQPHVDDGQVLTGDVAQSIADANPAAWKYDPNSGQLLNMIDGWSAPVGDDAALPTGWADWINSYDTARDGLPQLLDWTAFPNGRLDQDTANDIVSKYSDYILADDVSGDGRKILYNRRTHEAIPVSGQSLDASALDRLNGTLDPILLSRDEVMDRQAGYKLANANPHLLVIPGRDGQPDVLYNKYTHDAIPLDGHRITRADFGNLYAIPATPAFMNSFVGRSRWFPGIGLRV